MTTRHDIPEFTALKSILDGSSPEYRDQDIAEIIRKSKYGDAACKALLDDALAYQRSHNQKLAQQKRARAAAIAPLLRAIVENTPPSRLKAGQLALCERAADTLNEIIHFSPAEYRHAQHPVIRRVAEEVLDTGMLTPGEDRSFSALTIKDWFKGQKVPQMLIADGN